jgi:MFS family permease
VIGSPGWPRIGLPATYRALLGEPPARRLLAGLGVSALGDGMSAVTVAWLALQLAPADHVGVYVGLAVAAYTLPGVIGAWTLGGLLRHRPARALVLAHSALRAGLLGAVAVLDAVGALHPVAYVALLAGSSLLGAWGIAGEYTMLAEVGGPQRRLAVNSLASAQTSISVIVGPAVAGALLAPLGAGWLIAVDAASWAFLGIQAWRTPTSIANTPAPVDPAAAESGFRLLRRPDLRNLIMLTAIFFFLYGPVEDALPVYVAHDLHANAGLLGAYWTVFGVGALLATLITGTRRVGNIHRTTLLIVIGWGACLLPFAGAPVGVTLACFALGGLIYGPFIPLTYALFQSATTTANLPALFAARGAIIIAAAPLGTAVGGPLVQALGASTTLAASGAATVLLAAITSLTWRTTKHTPRSTPRP